MKKRMIVMLIAVVAFVAAIGALKFSQVRSAMAQGASFQPPPEAVTTSIARQESWPSTVAAIGTVTAVQGVTVSADLPGIVEKISFESGRTVGKGAVLVKLDTSQEEAQLRAAESKRNLARLNLDRMRGLRENGVISQAEYDRAAAEFTQGEAEVGEIRATIERKTIRAPFSGLLGIRQVNLGQYLNGGDPIVPLQSLRPVYVTFAVPQQEMAHLKAGTRVEVTAKGETSLKSTGRITAVDSVVDEATRNVNVQATFANADGRLRPGMFVDAQVLQGASTSVIALPATAISYAPYGDSVFIVEDVKGQDGKTFRGVRQQFVKLGGARGDLVSVISGIKAGEEVVTSGVFKLRPGAAVQVNNTIQPANSLTPRPEDS
ncbi:MAG TPA: efflux RND transporter periplasmic adaptor subunit [Thermoanaerobaculia bacterium]|jgi:membrane fusion protein (multidrug efflux system)|nr:efflux RND transporter periplasmic adaptor subunit [Thermoanaerobaculia bacterium]